MDGVGANFLLMREILIKSLLFPIKNAIKAHSSMLQTVNFVLSPNHFCDRFRAFLSAFFYCVLFVLRTQPARV